MDYDQCQVYHMPKGADEIQKVIFSSKSNQYVVSKSPKKIPKLREGLLSFKNNKKQHVPNSDSKKHEISGQKVKLKSLFQLCIDFIAKNAHELESLEDFPLDIGIQIWHSCKQLRSIPNDETVQILQTFCNAYQGEILEKCKLSDLLVINNYEKQIRVLFENCTVLDLSGCDLDETHDIVVDIPRICQKLTYLNLSNNKLSSKSLRLMFGIPPETDAQKSLFSDRFTCLENIDISGNLDITFNGIMRYVTHNKSIQKITLSGKSSTDVHNAFKPKWKLTPAGHFGPVKTEGLASDLINQWSERLQSQIEKKKSKLQKSQTSNSFYRQKNILPGKTQKIERNDFVFCVMRNENLREPPPKKKLKLAKFEDNVDEADILQFYK